VRVLFVASKKSDYLQDLCYAGLVEVLGKSNVLDHPRKLNYHLPTRRYPKNMGYQKGFPPISTIANFQPDLVVVGACKADAVERFYQLSPKLQTSTPCVWIDGGDRPDIGGDLARLGRTDLQERLLRDSPFNLIFKREMIETHTYGPTVKPFPLGLRSDFLPAPVGDLKYDLLFWATPSHDDRRLTFKMLEGKYDCDQNGSVPYKRPKAFNYRGQQYLKEMSRARISLNVRGGGWDTLRFWEALGMGSFMLSQKLPLVLPHPPISGNELVWLNEDLSDLYEKTDYYLAHPEQRAAIAERGKAWVLAHHDQRARAKQLLQAVAPLI